MKAVVFDQFGAPEVLRVADVPDIAPQAGEVLIRVRAIGVNPADGKIRSGMFRDLVPASAMPYIGGYDIAGEIIGGEGLPAGARVAAMVDPRRSGAYAELTVASRDRLAILPESLDYATAAALPCPGLTAIQMIDEQLDVQPGQRVAITGAVGSVGRFAVLAAKDRGAAVVAAVRENARDAAKALGADEVIVFGADYAGDAFDCVADTVGGDAAAALCRKVKLDGKIRTVATTPIPTEGVPVDVIFFPVHPDAAQLERLLDWAASGRIPIPVAAILPLDRAAEAQRRIEEGQAGGKIILQP